MERIQQAIAKARAARGSLQPELSGQAPMAQRFGGKTPSYGSDEAWAALTAFQPSEAHLHENRIATIARASGGIEFDKLRTRILQQMQAQKWRRIAITSAAPSSGKSTIAINVAFSLSRQTAARTILCETDLRRPSFSRLLGMPSKHDFARVLRGQAAFDKEAVRINDNLAICMSQNMSERSAELLHSADTAAAIDQIEATYDPTIMIFDMPPLLVSDDTMAFVDKVDCVLIIAAAGSTTIEQIDTCERELSARTNVLGVVLNKCRFTGSDQTYDYYG